LEQEAEELTNAGRYERTEERKGYRSGHYDRNLTTTSGNVKLKMPKLKGIAFETATIERYRRRESLVEEALIEMYLGGVSVRRVEDITEALWGTPTKNRFCQLNPIALRVIDMFPQRRERMANRVNGNNLQQ
jgi:transposase-like protein